MRYHPLVKKLRFSDFPRVRQLERQSWDWTEVDMGTQVLGNVGGVSKVYEFRGGAQRPEKYPAVPPFGSLFNVC